tara:strand:- start:162 stop:443 length:282 start_codon:yes stop_codon:yes gene_type:complete
MIGEDATKLLASTFEDTEKISEPFLTLYPDIIISLNGDVLGSPSSLEIFDDEEHKIVIAVAGNYHEFIASAFGEDDGEVWIKVKGGMLTFEEK